MANPNAGKSPHAARHFCTIDQTAEMCAKAVEFAGQNAVKAITANNAELARMFEARIKAERPLNRLRAWWARLWQKPEPWGADSRLAPHLSEQMAAVQAESHALSQNEVAP